MKAFLPELSLWHKGKRNFGFQWTLVKPMKTLRSLKWFYNFRFTMLQRFNSFPLPVIKPFRTWFLLLQVSRCNHNYARDNCLSLSCRQIRRENLLVNNATPFYDDNRKFINAKILCFSSGYNNGYSDVKLCSSNRHRGWELYLYFQSHDEIWFSCCTIIVNVNSEILPCSEVRQLYHEFLFYLCKTWWTNCMSYCRWHSLFMIFYGYSSN